jgi:thiosulfate/3-mercaptopyruvate sulfurtransferase
MSDYPADILVDVDWLKQHLADTDLRILDTRASDPRLPVGYRMGHIPGAIALDVGRDFFVFDGRAPQLASGEQIGQVLSRLGISNETRLVIYDEWTGQLVGFTYWVLRHVGHRDLKILHGGWAAWQKGQGQVTREAPSLAPASYRPGQDDDARATADWIEANAGRDDVVLLDARSDGEFAMGHIPGAVNLPYDFSLEPRTQTFRDAAALRAELEAVGATPDKEIVTYCASGARSSHMFTTLQLLGYPRVRNYDGSMNDWYHLGGRPIE